MHAMKTTTRTRFRETRRHGRYTVQAVTNAWGQIELRAYENTTLTGNHATIASRADAGDERSSPWVGLLRSRRSDCPLPVGEARFRFFRVRQARLAALEAAIARRAFPEWRIGREASGELVKI
jgi:hypothetical protein